MKFRYISRICIDWCIFILTCFSIYGMHKWLKPFKRGFFCNDESLKYPYLESTITLPILAATVFGIPLIIILVVELFRKLDTFALNDRKQLKGATVKNLGLRCRLCYRITRSYTQFGYFLFGLILTLVATELVKYNVGRLRPHFFSLCIPELSDGSNCTSSNNQGRYIEDYICSRTNISDFAVLELKQSFPSGHTSLVSYSMLYLIIYIQGMLNTSISKLFKSFLQFILMFIAWYIALTRINDYWHYWSDVLVGMLLGSSIAVFLHALVVKSFQNYKVKKRIATKEFKHSREQNKMHVIPMTTGTSEANVISNAQQYNCIPVYTIGTNSYLNHANLVYNHNYAGGS